MLNLKYFTKKKFLNFTAYIETNTLFQCIYYTILTNLRNKLHIIMIGNCFIDIICFFY